MAALVQKHQHRFAPGYNVQLRSIRLNLDPVKAVHRPCFFYAALFAMDCLGKILLHLSMSDRTAAYRSKVRRHRVRSNPKVTYWYRPGRTSSDSSDQAPLPVVFVHGLGAGITPYLKFVWKVARATSQTAPLYLIELPHVSMRFHEHAPTIPETTRELDAALREHGHRRAVFVGHSLGSAVVAGMCRWSRKRVAAVVLIDPICFLLHLPAVAYQFVHRPPTRANERFVSFFASRELFISRFISRSFHWYHSCMWADDLPAGDMSTVYLSQNDLLVPSKQVDRYLERQGVQRQMMPLDHAQFLFAHQWETTVAKDVAERALYHGNRRSVAHAVVY
ncbi:Alpha/Beta hydrolase protein [Thamnocephalis sphaerospora]|uniref:Alpha/Beta hydrolase protein n=1 Tax=Thamnocephalis sphaerospora TaxID=78915 RepID=A0A4V1IVW0_9FUNG|nr:Alpha/Beta hydrolase protein [Thamnocephalis sphaerospora]|eukprot:RKP05429.1 Alpha/Beta hydrolase protein [Thamnocephalis sphaerospora]